MTKCDAIDVSYSSMILFSTATHTDTPRTKYSKDLIRVNAVCPGVIDTPMTQPNAEVLAPAVSIAPMGRMGTAQEVADCILFLASSKASFVQGAALVVDGGYTIN